MRTLHLTMHGRVQGVYFRDSMRHEALALGITGWVRNQGNGTVEAVVQGDDRSVDAIVTWAHRSPQYAQVERVDIASGNGNYSSFEIIR